MNSPLPPPSAAQPSAPPPAERRGWGRRLVNLLVALVVTAVAAATFVFSYDGVHAIALLGGMSAQLARYYPGLFDAVIVIACVAAVVLRDGRWWARLWAWAVLVVVLAAIGATDVVNAVHYTLPHRRIEGVVAAAPVVAVLLAFSLLLTMLRQSRTRPGVTVPSATGAIAVLAPPLPIALPAAPAAELPPPPAFPPPPTAPPATTAIPAPPLGAPAAAHAPTEPTPAIAAGTAQEPPTVAAPSPDEDTAPPTVPVPARDSRSIRYAGNTPPQRAWELPADESAAPAVKATSVEESAARGDYWESEEAGPFAGLVYSARDDESGEPAKPNPEPGDDAPPFATAPHPSVPRLNRQRSTPAPPADDEDE
jgi:hypothetical protein